MTATSTPARRNISNAMAVVTSKNVGVTASVPSDFSRSTTASTSSAVCCSVLRVNRRVVR